MTKTTDSLESTLFCSAEYHLVALGSVTALGIYKLALRIAKRTSRFSASSETLAAYFNKRKATIIDALHLLEANGWFKKLLAEPGKPVVYRPVHHPEWEVNNLGVCVEKIVYPWSDEKQDELGRMLYAHADGRFRIYPNILKGLRNTGHTDNQIENHFTQFWVGDSHKRGVWGRFIKYLRQRPARVAA